MKPAIGHVLNLNTIGGVERSFTSFLSHPSSTNNFDNHVVSSSIHPVLAGAVRQNATSISNYKRVFHLPVPKLRLLRSSRIYQASRQQDVNAVLFWNHMDHSALLWALHRKNIASIYFEHGMAWRPSRKQYYCQFLSKVQHIFANSHAAGRMLGERWGVKQQVEVLPNALRPEVTPSQPQTKTIDVSRPIRLGVAGRLIPLKGISLALHMLKILISKGTDCELCVAGQGSENDNLAVLAKQLGIAEKVHFLGLVSDMPQFYRHIDLLLVPSIREPFGLVSIEAQAWGCPVIVAGVDGLAETVLDGITGYAIEPTLQLSDYEHLGGTASSLPSLVYFPHKDAIGSPLLLDPSQLASAVMKAVSSPQHYETLSKQASLHGIGSFNYEQYMHRLVAAIRDAYLQT